MKRFRIQFLVMILLSVVPVQAAEVIVFAAASLVDAIQELRVAYETQSVDRIVFNFDSSSFLARQIAEGAPADLFISADEAKLDFLQEKGMILDGTRQDLLSNSLVIVARENSSLALESPLSLAGPQIKKLALAQPQTVPAGIYAKEYLSQIGIWEQLKDRVVPTANVRAALSAVESGNVDAGMVYKTDAAISKKVKVIFALAPEKGPKIIYPLAVIKDSKNAAAAKKFSDYLFSQSAREVFEKYGFITLKK